MTFALRKMVTWYDEDGGKRDVPKHVEQSKCPYYGIGVCSPIDIALLIVLIRSVERYSKKRSSKVHVPSYPNMPIQAATPNAVENWIGWIVERMYLLATFSPLSIKSFASIHPSPPHRPAPTLN
jgi:hypothetical protein